MQKSQQNLIDKLDSYMAREHLSAKEVAKMLGVSQNTMTNWKKGTSVISPKNCKAIEQLTYNFNNVSKKSGDVQFLDTSDFVKVPLLSVAQAAELRPQANGGPNDIPIDEIVYFDKAFDGDFAVLVSGHSMEPWYPAGTKVLVGREDKPHTGDRVIAMIADYSEPIFKTYVDLGSNFALLSINRSEGCDPIIIDKMDRDAWFWVWPIKATVRIERDVDAAMKKHGVHHFWEKWLEEYNKKQ